VTHSCTPPQPPPRFSLTLQHHPPPPALASFAPYCRSPRVFCTTCLPLTPPPRPSSWVCSGRPLFRCHVCGTEILWRLALGGGQSRRLVFGMEGVPGVRASRLWVRTPAAPPTPERRHPRSRCTVLAGGGRVRPGRSVPVRGKPRAAKQRPIASACGLRCVDGWGLAHAPRGASAGI